jgi:hypothetical protein
MSYLSLSPPKSVDPIIRDLLQCSKKIVRCTHSNFNHGNNELTNGESHHASAACQRRTSLRGFWGAIRAR